MDIRRLEVFCKVVELKSFTKAAEAALLSQPSVSEHIRVLEETLGEKLIDRLGREVAPTQAGQILFQYARQIIRLRDEAQQAIQEFRGNLSGQLSLGASTIPGAFLLPKSIEAFKLHHPTIQLLLKISGTSTIVEGVMDGTLELGVIGAAWKDPRLESVDLFADELILTVHPDHPWAKRKSVSPDELYQEPFIFRERGSGTRIVMTEALKGAGIDPEKFRQVAEMGSSEAVRQGIKSRIGVSILSSLSIAEDLQLGSLVQVPIEGLRMPRSFFLIKRKNRQLSPLALAFYEHLLQRQKAS